MWWVAGSGPARPPPCNRGPIRPCRGRSGRSDCPTRSVVARADPAYLTRPAQRGRTALGLTAAPVPCETIPWTDSVRRAVVRRNSTTCDGPGNRTTGDRCIGRAAASGDPGPGPGRWVSDGGCLGGPVVCQPPAVLGAVEFAGVQQVVGEPVLVGVPGSAGGHPAGQVRGHHRVLVLAEDVLQVRVAVDAVRRLLLAQHRAPSSPAYRARLPALRALCSSAPSSPTSPELRCLVTFRSAARTAARNLAVRYLDTDGRLALTASGGCERRRV